MVAITTTPPGAASDATRTGSTFPIGPAATADGPKLSVYAKRAERLDLLLFDAPEADAPERVIELDPEASRTAAWWHVFVPGVTAGQVYGLRAHGPFAPERGLRFDGRRLLLDPYARA